MTPEEIGEALRDGARTSFDPAFAGLMGAVWEVCRESAQR